MNGTNQNIADNDLANLVGEIWQSIPDYDGLYEASNMGRIKSLHRVVNGPFGTERVIKERILKPGLTRKTKEARYYLVQLSNEGIQKVAYIHRVVAKLFLPPPIDGETEVLHIDHNTLNNRASNLKWGTTSDRMKQAFNIGRAYAVPLGKFGADSHSAKPITAISINNDIHTVFESRIDAAKWLIENGFAKKQNLQNIISAINKAAIGKTRFSYSHKWVNHHG